MTKQQAESRVMLLLSQPCPWQLKDTYNIFKAQNSGLVIECSNIASDDPETAHTTTGSLSGC